jgi:hypothetical protein
MTAEAARIVTAQRSEAKDHNLVPEAARQTVSKGVQYEKRPVKGTDGKPVAGLFNAWITLDNQTQFNSFAPQAPLATLSPWCLPALATKPFVLAEIPRNTRNTTPAILRNTGDICGSSTTWFRQFLAATSRWSAA